MKTYRAADLKTALALVKKELGPDAVILETRNIEDGGVKKAEVVAASDPGPLMASAGSAANPPPPPRTKPAHGPNTTVPATSTDQVLLVRELIQDAITPLRRELVSLHRRIDGISGRMSQSSQRPDLSNNRDERLPNSQSSRAVPGYGFGGTRADSDDLPASPATDDYTQESAEDTGEAQADEVTQTSEIQQLVNEWYEGELTELDGPVEPMDRIGDLLYAEDIPEDVVIQLISETVENLTPSQRLDDHVVQARFLMILNNMIRVGKPLESACVPPKPRPTSAREDSEIGVVSPQSSKKSVVGSPGVVAFVGPTGVGKTTTIAKLATTMIQDRDLTVLLVALGPAATDMAAELERRVRYLPVAVASSTADLEQLIDQTSADLVLIDTPGHNPRNTREIAELGMLLRKVEDLRIELLLSAVTSVHNLRIITANYERLGYDQLLFTKLDETISVGNLLTLMREVTWPVSYFATGRRIPEDLETASPERILAQLLPPSFWVGTDPDVNPG